MPPRRSRLPDPVTHHRSPATRAVERGALAQFPRDLTSVRAQPYAASWSGRSTGSPRSLLTLIYPTAVGSTTPVDGMRWLR